MNTAFLIQLLVNGLVVGTLYGVVAMSFVLIYKATQVVNFAQGELLLIGAWVCLVLLNKFQVPFWLGMPLTLVFMFAFGIAIQIVILRPMIGEPIISVIMVTIGLSTVFQAALKWIFGVDPQPFPRVFQSQSVDFFGAPIQTVYVMSLIVSLVDDDRHGLVLPLVEIRPRDARDRLQPAGGAVARHLREERVRDGLGDLGYGLRGRGCRGRRRQRRVVGPVGLWHQGVSRGDPRRARTRSAAPCSAASSSVSWKTSRNMSTASICTGAISMRSRRFTC